MAAKPIERFVKKQIADQGGWPRILEPYIDRLEAGIRSMAPVMAELEARIEAMKELKRKEGEWNS